MNFFQLIMENVGGLFKARKSATLVPIKKLAHREDGTTFWQTFWVTPAQAKAAKTGKAPQGGQLGLFDDGPDPDEVPISGAQLGLFEEPEEEPPQEPPAKPEKKKTPFLGIKIKKQSKPEEPKTKEPAMKVDDLFSGPEPSATPEQAVDPGTHAGVPPKAAGYTLPSIVPDDTKTRIMLGDRPEGVPQDWIVFNAPRPLSGTKTWQGDFVSGIFYSAIDPKAKTAKKMIKYNLENGAFMLLYQDKEVYAEAKRKQLLEKYKYSRNQILLDKIKGFTPDQIVEKTKPLDVVKFGDIKGFYEDVSAPEPEKVTAPAKEPVLAVKVKKEKPAAGSFAASISETTFRDYGSWSASGKHLSPKARGKLNEDVAHLILKPRDEITNEDKDKIRQYSGFGGVSADDERGVLYDFYTSPPVAKMTWKLLDSIDPIKPGDSILEPACGTGVFFETAPEGLSMTGVELDTRTAACASILQDKAKIRTGSFEEFNLSSDEEFDRIVGNAPFGDRSVLTSFMDMPEEGSLDKYFLRRSLDRLAPGGTMGMIVHPGVMSGKLGEAWRADMCRHGQFMGAVKLPDKSFKHTSTQVQPDIIFFRKYPEEVEGRLSELSEEQFKQTPFYNAEWATGTYFKARKDHILGTLQEGAGQWGSDVVSGALTHEDMDKAIATFKPEPPISADALSELVEATPEYNPEARKPIKVGTLLTDQESAAVAAKTLTVGMTKTVDGKVYRLNKNHRWELVDADIETASKIAKIKAIASKVKAIRDAMQTESPVDDLQREARSMIQAFMEAHGTSTADDPDVKKFLKNNPATTGVFEGLVGIDDAILTKESIYEPEITIIDGHQPEITALRKIQENMARATVENIQSYFPNQAESLISSMKSNPDVFLAADGAWELREDFIAGDGRKKVKALKALIQEHPDWADEVSKWQYGIDELEKAMGWVGIEDASIVPQLSWIPEEFVDRWIKDEAIGSIRPGFAVSRSAEGKWGLRRTVAGADTEYYDRYTGRYEVEPGEPAGTWEESNADFLYFLNNYKQKSKYTDTETFNDEAIDSFRMWAASNDDVRTQLEGIFNDLYNNEISAPTKTYSVKIDGWDYGRKTVNSAVWQSVHHLYRAGKGISALGTGFGKTLAAITLFSLLRQEGKTKRGFFQVPNNKVKDWVEEFKVMPGLKIGFIDPETKGYQDRDTRYKMYQDLANGEWDAIILPESAASEIQLSKEADKEITNSVIEGQLNDKGSDRKNQQAKDAAESKMENGKTNRTINFEDFGCDTIFVDESHNYKNLFTSSLSRETGMNDGRRSDRAMSLFKKNEYMRRKNGGSGVFLLTATPLTNSPLEYYNMLMHVAPEELAAKGIKNIDDFIRNFAVIETGDKYDWGSGKASVGRILRGFRNIQSLQSMFFKYTDLQNDASKINIIKPTAHNRPNLLKRDTQQVEQIKKIATEMEHFKTLSKEARDATGENFLTFYSRMRTVSLDLELYDPKTFKGWKNPKIETMAENAFKSYTATGGGQMVFCDRVMSGDGSFNMHDKIKKSLIAQGFKESEIVVVNGLTKSGKKSDSAIEREVSAAVAGFKTGKYKVIIGTTAMLGEGVNMQDNASALHHLDIPYRPSDFIQRNGRIDRQGNKQKNVELHTYMSSGTIDSYSVSLVQGKSNWIDKLLKTKSAVFTNPNDDQQMDVDEILLSLSEEFGDDDEVDKRKQAVADMRAKRIREANMERIHNNLQALTMTRASLRNYTGDKGSKGYQNLLRKQSITEKTLSSIPEFHYFSILGEKPTDFIYLKKYRKVLKVGDCLCSPEGMHKVVTLNMDKQDAELVKFKESSFSLYGPKISHFRFSAVQQADPRSYVVMAEDVAKDSYQSIKNSSDAGFIGLPASVKTQLYVPFYSGLKTSAYFENKGKVNVDAFWRQDNGARVLNPYEPEDRKKIQDAVNSGMIPYGEAEKTAENSILIDAGIVFPELKKSVRIWYIREA